MFNRISRAMKSQKGFTLVELMVVVVIIGVLVAIAVPIYNNVTANAEEAAQDANARTLNAALSMWVAADPDNNDPTSLANVAAVEAVLSPTYIAADDWDTTITELTWDATTGRFTN